MSRAPAMAPEQRRAAILAAALPVLLEHGRGATTRQIADAAGVAEGTIFRVFATKDEIFAAALEAEIEPGPLLADLGAIELALPLRERLLAIADVTQQRFRRVFHLMTALGVVGPLPRRAARGEDDARAQTAEAMRRLLEPDAERFRVPIGLVIQMLRMLTFSGSHPHLSEVGLLSPEQIVDVIAHGTLRPEEHAE